MNKSHFAIAWTVVALAIGLGGYLTSGVANAASNESDLLIKFSNTYSLQNLTLLALQSGGAHIETVGSKGWVRVQLTAQQAANMNIDDIRNTPGVAGVQPNYRLHLLTDYRIQDPVKRAKLMALWKAGKLKTRAGSPIPVPGSGSGSTMPADNPPFPTVASGGTGDDPDYPQQWGMNDMGVKNGWGETRGQGMIVAVIDTGVDYTHEDLVDNMWRNPGETGTDSAGKDKTTNGIDDDSNGFIDDVVGWDFASNDNKPFDLAVEPIQILFGGGNPGHGTHCAGNVAARANNGKGVAGVAPEAKIMAMRFLTEKGEGDTAGAIKAIEYAVKNGAKVLSNSWGSEGDDPAEADKNQALKDQIKAAQDKGVLFIAAAGNGHSGVGYDNDSDAKPGYPASYDMDNIISVAAVDSNNKLGAFSNWGAKTVDIAAPGVKVFSTTVGGHYNDMVVDIFGIKASWDGTSMATPHVAGAAALYWAKHPSAKWSDVKDAILKSAKPVPELQGKMVSGGKLNVEELMKR